MNVNLSPDRPRPVAPALFSKVSSPLLLAALVAALGLGVAGCENKHIGRSCDVAIDGGAASAQSGTWNGQALECPTRLCVKQGVSQGVASSPDTTAFCSAECSSDGDCDDGETRNEASTTDKRCKGGFFCGVGYVIGDLCCKKICLCKDFLPKTGYKAPAFCDANSPVKCANATTK